MATASVPGVIEENALYRLDEFLLRAGWTRKSWDSARRRGLRALRSGKRVYVRGSDAREFIEKDTADQAARLAQATS